jgi:hypothetical protein
MNVDRFSASPRTDTTSSRYPKHPKILTSLITREHEAGLDRIKAAFAGRIQPDVAVSQGVLRTRRLPDLVKAELFADPSVPSSAPVDLTFEVAAACVDGPEPRATAGPNCV